MVRVQQDVLKLEKQGDVEAIETLLNRSMEPKGVAAKIGRKENCLFVSLVSEQVPDQQELVLFIREAIISWGVQSLKTAKIYGRQINQISPAWQQDVELDVQTSATLIVDSGKTEVAVASFIPNNNRSLHIQGEIGQLVVGNHNIVIGSIHGGVVNILSPEQQPHLRSRSTPVFLLPRSFPHLLGRKDEISTAIAAFQSQQSVEFYSQPGLGRVFKLVRS